MWTHAGVKEQKHAQLQGGNATRKTIGKRKATSALGTASTPVQREGNDRGTRLLGTARGKQDTMALLYALLHRIRRNKSPKGGHEVHTRT